MFTWRLIILAIGLLFLVAGVQGLAEGSGKGVENTIAGIVLTAVGGILYFRHRAKKSAIRAGVARAVREHQQDK